MFDLRLVPFLGYAESQWTTFEEEEIPVSLKHGHSAHLTNEGQGSPGERRLSLLLASSISSFFLNKQRRKEQYLLVCHLE